MASNLNLNVTFDAFVAVQAVDEKFIGTKDYMGVAWFWAHKYRHFMRDATYAKRRQVHKAFVKADLETAGTTIDHDGIINRIFKAKFGIEYD